jgi:hypothetical protein
MLFSHENHLILFSSKGKTVSRARQVDYNLSLVEYELVSIAGVGASAAAANSAVTAEA